MEIITLHVDITVVFAFLVLVKSWIVCHSDLSGPANTVEVDSSTVTDPTHICVDNPIGISPHEDSKEVHSYFDVTKSSKWV